MKYYVYWIHHNNHDDIFSQGYIGITNNSARRFYQHQKGQSQNKHFSNALKKYSPKEILWDIILIGTKEYCKEIEFKLRSKENIGWNIEKGGGIPPSQKGKRQSKEHIKNRIKPRKGKPSPCKGQKRSDNTKKAISKALKGSIFSEERKLNISKALKGRIAPNKGKKQSKKEIIKKSKTWKIITPFKEEFIIINLKQFCIENNLNRNYINKYGYKGWKAELII
jgi:predicted GIY-YIG superfamily endonuclease